jgi:hypothetical protein
MGTWTNADGLYVKSGVTEATQTQGGTFHFGGGDGSRTLEVEIDLTTLGTTDGAIIVDNAVIPKGSQIVEVKAITEIAAAGGTSYTVGLYKLDRTTALSNTGIINAALLATVDAVGETTQWSVSAILPAATAGIGALVGTITTDAGLLTAKRVGTFTTGRVTVQIKYRPNALVSNVALVS